MNRLALFFYNLLFFPLLLILLPGYLLRMVRRGGYREKFGQRFGLFNHQTLHRIGTGRIWIHAASVGEVGVALKFISEYGIQNPSARFLLSVTTSTGLAIAEKNSSERLEVIANPVDFPFFTRRLIRRFHPSALLFVEADLWPNRVEAARSLGIPIILINARLSVRSERRFHKVKVIAAPFFNSLSMMILTETEDRDRWLSLGVRPDIIHLAGNIKYDSTLSAGSQPPRLPKGLGWSLDDPILLAASTHEGEELEIARSYLAVRNAHPTLRLVITPRHVERRTEIVTSLRSLGLSVALRTEHSANPDDILLLDTTGELSSWYPVATVVFVGKSLPCSVNQGGQNMIEPLLATTSVSKQQTAGCSVLIGPHTRNFEPLATRLCEAGAALRVADAKQLAAALSELLLDPVRRNTMILAANAVLAPHQGATQRICSLVTECTSGIAK